MWKVVLMVLMGLPVRGQAVVLQEPLWQGPAVVMYLLYLWRQAGAPEVGALLVVAATGNVLLLYPAGTQGQGSIECHCISARRYVLNMD
jgi:hypothetical protein